MKISIVIPTIREASIIKFLKEWKPFFGECQIIVVEDNPTKTFDIKGVEHYSWKEIDAELKKDSWIIPRKSSSIKSFGFLKAYHSGADIIVSLDDDCYPHDDTFLNQHVINLDTLHTLKWTNTLMHTNVVFPRGFPYDIRNKNETVISHGLWLDNPDLDAISEIANEKYSINENTTITELIPYNNYFPMCGMNLAFKREVAPAMYFMLMGKNYPYDRFDDIWAGIFVKKICDHLEKVITNGLPYIRHIKASNKWVNLIKEAPGLEINEWLWKEVDKIKLTKHDFKSCYIELAKQLPERNDYFMTLKKAMQLWANQF